MTILRPLATVALVLTIATAAFAQTDLHDWNTVKNIPPGSDIWIKGARANVTGSFQSADDDAIHILQWRRRPFTGGSYSQPCTIPRSEVRQVRFTKRPLSAFAGTAIGVAAGAGIGAAIDSPARNHEARGIVMFTLGFFGGLLGEGVGEHTAFIHGTKIYVAP